MGGLFPPAEGEQFGCSGIYEVETGRVLARNCDTSGLRFAPYGRHLLGMRGDNAMFGQVQVYDEELPQVSVYQPPGKGVVKTAAWADESHLFVVIADLDSQPGWSLLRVPIDGGAPETVVGPVAGPNPEMPRRSCCPTDPLVWPLTAPGTSSPGSVSSGPCLSSESGTGPCVVPWWMGLGGAGHGTPRRCPAPVLRPARW